MIRLLVLITIPILFLSAFLSLDVQAQSTVQFAGIDTLGNCGETDGEYDYELTAPTLAAGPEVGSALSRPAGQSFSVVPVSISELTASEASVVLTDSDIAILACGNIGGVADPDGSIVFGISEVDTSGVSGIAYLAPAPDGLQTNVSLFVTGLAPDTAIVPEVEDAETIAEPAPAPTVAQIEDEVGLTDDELLYVSVLSSEIEKITDSAFRMSDLFQNPRFGQDDWTIDVAAEFVLWRSMYEEAQTIAPPQRFTEIHATFLEMLRLMDSASYDFATGVDTLDASMLEQGSSKVSEATALMNEITRLLEELQTELGL